MDNKTDLAFAKTDPKGFLGTYSPPVIIDEIQYAKELFPYVKMLADASDKRGQVWIEAVGIFMILIFAHIWNAMLNSL